MACWHCRPRTKFDTTAGILVSYSTNTFWVHCQRCHRECGPFKSLAEAQGVTRVCVECELQELRELREQVEQLKASRN